MKSTKLVPPALLLLPALLAAGCGGSSSSGPGGATPAARSYAEVVTLPTGQAGALTLAVQPNNSVTGTLIIAGVGTAAASLRPHATAGPHLLAPIGSGSFPVTGYLTGAVFTLGGADFTLTGTLPGGAQPVNFTLTSGGAGGPAYTGTLATASGSNSAIAGAYHLTSISNPATGQTVACPGTLAFGSSNNDVCTASEIYTLNGDGSYTLAGVGAANAGTYSLVGNIMIQTGPTISNGQNGPPATSVSSVVINGNTLTSTLLDTTYVTSQSELNQSQYGEVSTFTKSGTAVAFAHAGAYTLNSSTTDVITITGTRGGNQGSYTITGSGTDTSGQTQNLTLTESRATG